MKAKKINKRSANEFDAYVGKRLREARKIHGFTQEQLAEKMGLTFQQIQKYEKGTNRLCVERIAQISDIFGRPVTWFFPVEHQSDISVQIDACQQQVFDLTEHLKSIEAICQQGQRI